MLAPPGSGKGTLSELLRERKNFYVLSAGKIFRTLISRSAEGSQELAEVNKGGYLSDEIVNKYMIQELDSIQEAALKGAFPRSYIVLDGYPRTIGQAKKLEWWAAENELIVVQLEGLNESQISQRLNNRYLCEAHEHIFNALNNFPQDGRCPKDGSKLIKRQDDLEAETIKKRLSQHESLTTPIWEYYKQKNIRSIVLNSSSTVEELYDSFCKIVLN
ncbi:adenylate kinase family protein [Candidatus Mycoplasma haematominutum]|uniref:Adenylate kinase n=1 Tax=Candidatus Mycoplasma haematominutum 'Birmingham 1' TaxID=1116213 RepID=G8C335_9MOLU|nr:nucleoside monophosphate kinase [Candidatus Mycoplasma haematominutum]CCE66733.1 adenylate kinase [Candidatus Mycoplasma haematominutum 'Birmingham 1']